MVAWENQTLSFLKIIQISPGSQGSLVLVVNNSFLEVSCFGLMCEDRDLLLKGSDED